MGNHSAVASEPGNKKNPPKRRVFSFKLISSAGFVSSAGCCRFNKKPHSGGGASHNSDKSTKHNDTREHIYFSPKQAGSGNRSPAVKNDPWIVPRTNPSQSTFAKG